ncbi:DUF899 domain-containing protein [bacterium]|nr:MAG: DUF899 domain-containing protein [bacterium]
MSISEPAVRPSAVNDLQSIPHPPVVPRDEWLVARKALLLGEKALTRERDRLNAERRRLPMVKVEKAYAFDTPQGTRSLLDLFEGRRQLVVYHFMFDPVWDEGCMGCTGYIDALGDLSNLAERDTTFVLVSRASLDKLEAYRAAHGWPWSWVSSYGSDFNADFGVTVDDDHPEYNYRPETDRKGEQPGTSVFFRMDDDVYHTYSVFARGGENLTDAVALLDITPYGRQEDFEDSPEGWPQKPTYG